MDVNSIYIVALPIILLMIMVEVLVANTKNIAAYKKEDSLGTLGLLTGNIFVALSIKGVTLAFHIFLYEFRFFDLVSVMPEWALWIITFILIDFIFYFYHRISHRSRFLWAIHMSHHSSEEMNFVVSLRQAWFAPFAKVIFFMPLPLIGFDPLITVVVGIVSTFWGVIGHTQWINKLGPLEYIFVTPSHHRVHHGSNDQYIDKNFGNLLIIWDKFFGTFEPEDEKVIYGIKENVKTFNPFKITFMLWIKMYEESKSAVGFKEKFLSFFGTLEWKPKKLQ